MRCTNLTLSLLTLGVCAIFAAPNAHAQVATYQFNNTLNADQPGVVALNSVNPNGLSGFQADTVLGTSRVVYRFTSNTTAPADQSGLTLNSTGLVASNTYSVEALFRFDRVNGFNRVLDTQNRQSDSGFYVANSALQDYPQAASVGAGFTANIYHDVFLTVSSNATNNVSAYLDGAPYFTVTSTDLNLDSNHVFSFFLDNVAGGGIGEYSSGAIAQLRIYNSVLSPGQIATISANPLANPTATPEPGNVALLLGMGLSGAGFCARRRKSVRKAS